MKMSFDPASIKVDASKFYFEFNIAEAAIAKNLLESKKGPGNDFLGWMDLPGEINETLFKSIEDSAKKLRELDALVVVGIGGSYLGARTVIEAMKDPFLEKFPVYYMGHNLDAGYYVHLLNHLADKRYGVNVISKSGTTTEPALAFRYLWKDLKERFGTSGMRDMVVVTTDATKGSLRNLAKTENLTTYIVPDDIGGRYSVFTPVGLLPIACAGIDIRNFIEGAKKMRNHLKNSKDAENQAIVYAAMRNAAYRNGKKIEILATNNSGMNYFAEWWKQLYGESEGKNKRGIFPASVNLTTDLHSLGQWMQDGERSIFETVIDILKSEILPVPLDSKNEDGLNYLYGKDLHEINRTALIATIQAHHGGGVPCIRLAVPEISEVILGAMMYMFEYACGISAYILGVNPFDQPGVEAYKSEMFKLLGKPGI
jgi:glucose-6-phosphate isomerase